MKRFLVLLTVMLCLGLTACGKGADAAETPPAAEPEPAAETVPAPRELEEAPPAEPAEWNEVWEVPETARISLLQAEYHPGAERMTLVVENIGAGELGFGRHAAFERFVDEAWSPVEFEDDAFFHDDMLLAASGSARTLELPVWQLKQPLEEGLYRVSGTPLWIDGEQTASGWQVDFRVDNGAPPELDYALYIPGQPVSSVAEELPVIFINTTGQDGQVVDIPHLERRNEAGEWVEVPYRENVGFCGTPSLLPAEGRAWSEDAVMLWGVLEEGQYRLGYQAGRDFETDGWAYGEFDVCLDLAICGYPLAEEALPEA